MVKKERVKRKIPELLVDGPVTDRLNWNKYQLNRYKLRRMEKKNQSFLNRCSKRIVDVLKELEEAMEQEI